MGIHTRRQQGTVACWWGASISFFTNVIASVGLTSAGEEDVETVAGVGAEGSICVRRAEVLAAVVRAISWLLGQETGHCNQKAMSEM